MKKYWWILIVPTLLLLWWGLDRRDATVTVHLAEVRRGHIESTVPTNGKVDPAEWAAARVESAGVVRSLNVQRGQRVKAGDVLVTLDLTAAQAGLATAMARRQEAQAELAVLTRGGRTSQVASLESQLKAAQDAVEVAQRNYAAEQRLASQQAATKYTVQEAQDALTRAKQQLTAAQAQQKALITSEDRTIAEAKLHDAEAAVMLAQHRVQTGTIRAPMSGTVYQFDLKVGAYLQPGDQVALVGNVDQMKIAVYVDEPDLGRIAAGMPVVIAWDGKPGKKWTGRVDKLPTEVITLGTRNVGEVNTLVENPDHDLLPGVTVNATIISKVVDNAVMIPKAALRSMGSGNGVSTGGPVSNGAFRVRDRTLEWAPVQTGISDINNVQIISGLKPRDQVVDRVVNPSDAEITAGLRVKTITN